MILEISTLCLKGNSNFINTHHHTKSVEMLPVYAQLTIHEYETQSSKLKLGQPRYATDKSHCCY